MIQKYSGLPIQMDSVTGELSFHDGLLCDGGSFKKVGQMAGLFRNMNGVDENALVYRAYRNIRLPQDDRAFQSNGLRYDITVVLPGTVNGEFYKTSGHYHAYTNLKRYPYPEVYEVIAGEVIFVLQRNPRFNQTDGGEITQLQAVQVKAGQSIIIPPHCGHGSANPRNEISAFSNIAVIACPNDYEPIRHHMGLAAYILKDEGSDSGFLPVPNEHYGKLPEIEIAEPVENPALGIEFGVPCYGNYVEHSDRYDFLLNPDNYMGIIDQMTMKNERKKEKHEAADCNGHCGYEKNSGSGRPNPRRD